MSTDPTGGPIPAEASGSNDRREEARVLSVLRVGKMITAQGEELCRIRNISAGGIMAEVGSTRAIGDPVAIELRDDEPVTGAVVWIRGATIGIRFDRHVDPAEALTSARLRPGHAPRPPRLNLACQARLRVGAKYYNVQVRDLSQGGAKVELSDPYCASGREAVITIPGLPSVEGIVRWCRDGVAGIAFNQAIPFEELTGWLGARFAAAAGRA